MALKYTTWKVTDEKRVEATFDISSSCNCGRKNRHELVKDFHA